MLNQLKKYDKTSSKKTRGSIIYKDVSSDNTSSLAFSGFL